MPDETVLTEKGFWEAYQNLDSDDPIERIVAQKSLHLAWWHDKHLKERELTVAQAAASMARFVQPAIGALIGAIATLLVRG